MLISLSAGGSASGGGGRAGAEFPLLLSYTTKYNVRHQKENVNCM